jgi:hypothetical protein
VLLHRGDQVVELVAAFGAELDAAWFVASHHHGAGAFAGRGSLCGGDVDEDARLVAHHPGIVAGADDMRIARTEVGFSVPSSIRILNRPDST